MQQEIMDMESSNITDNTVSLGDMGLIAALVTLGFPIAKTENIHQRINFVFSNTVPLQTAVSQYWANKLAVPAREYSDNTKMLKGRIYSERGL